MTMVAPSAGIETVMRTATEETRIIQGPAVDTRESEATVGGRMKVEVAWKAGVPVGIIQTVLIAKKSGAEIR